jgi:hypothetical protein
LLTGAQQLDGSWGGILSRGPESMVTTEYAMLRLCELGLESSDAVEACLEKALLPTLITPDVIWEYESVAPDDLTRRAARQLVRDKTLHLICRATRRHDAVLKPFMETMLAEWDHYLKHVGDRKKSAHTGEIPPPTANGYAAVCWYPWSDDDFERVRALMKRLMLHGEDALDHPATSLPIYSGQLFTLHDRTEYWSRPDLLFHDLELSARFGSARDHAVSRWLLEELEARQDADGWYRFDPPEPFEVWWYFPLEKTSPEEFAVEWSFRAALILKLLEYDI